MAIYLGTNKISPVGPNAFLTNGHLLTTKTYSFNLGQTNYSSITPTTSQQSLNLFTTAYTTTVGTSIICYRLGSSYDGTEINRYNNDYVILGKAVVEYNYGTNNVTSTIHGIRSTYARDYYFTRYTTSINSSTGQIGTSIGNQTGGTYTNSCTPYLYQKVDNTYAITTSQGIYVGGASASLSGSAGAEYMDLTFGPLYVKYNDSYCPLTCLQAINPSQTIINITWEVYEGSRNSLGWIYNESYRLAFNS